MEDFERKIAESIENYSIEKKDTCPDEVLLEFYIQGRLKKTEENVLKAHLNECPACLKKIVELRESLWLFEKSRKRGYFLRFLNFLFTLPVKRKVAFAFAVVLIIFSVLFFVKINFKTSEIKNFVTVDVLTAEGKIADKTRGVILNSEGLVLIPLSCLHGAEQIQLHLPDGKIYKVSRIWKDEEKNIALAKVDSSFEGARIASVKDVHAGQKIYLISFKDGKKYNGFITDVKPIPSRKKGNPAYLSILLSEGKPSDGVVFDNEGKVLGFTVTSEERVVFASFIEEAVKEIRKNEPVYLKNLKVNRNTDMALYYYFKGILAADFNKKQQAMQYFMKAVELDPYLEGPHFELAGFYYEQRRYDLEMQEYLKILQINPENDDAMFYLASCYETKGMYEEAIKLYEKLLKRNPEDAETMFNLGIAYLTVGQKEKAKALYPKLKEIDPGFGEKLRRLAVGG